MISCIKSRIPRCGQGSIELVSVEDIDAASDVYQSSQQCESVAPAANNVFQNTLFLFVREIIGADNVSSIHGDTSVREKTETADICSSPTKNFCSCGSCTFKAFPNHLLKKHLGFPCIRPDES